MSKAKATKQGTTDEPEVTKSSQAATAALGPIITFWQNRCKATFSTAVMTVVKIPATEFAKRMPKDAVSESFFSRRRVFFVDEEKKKKCGVCEEDMLGECQNAFELTPTNWGDADATPIYVHGEQCFACTAAMGPDDACKCDVSFGNSDPKTGARQCHVDRDKLPVCPKHIDTHALDFPSFDPLTQVRVLVSLACSLTHSSPLRPRRRSSS
jgi:hypothetical protein